MSERKYDVFQVVDMIGTKRFQGVFTKSDLSKIMDGALYKHKFRTETQDELFNNGWGIRKDKVDGCVHWEWINPLIELVPIEGELNE